MTIQPCYTTRPTLFWKKQSRWGGREKKTEDSRCKTSAHNMFRALSRCLTDSDISIWSRHGLLGLFAKRACWWQWQSYKETCACKLIFMQIKVLGLTGGFPMTGIQIVVSKFVGAPLLLNSENVSGHLQVTEVVPICWKQVIMSFPHTNIPLQHHCSTL